MRTKLLKKALLVAGLAILICGFSIQASAITFNFQEETGFKVGGSNLVSNGPSGSKYNDIKWYNDATAPVAPLAGTFNTIAWGASNNVAALLGFDPFGPIGNPSPNDINTAYSGIKVLGQQGGPFNEGEWVTITQLYHQNNAISANYSTLTGATIDSILRIGIGTPPPYGGALSDPNAITLSFNETSNAAPCGPGSPSGAVCPDYFQFAAGGFDALPFSYGNADYLVYFNMVAGAGATVQYLDLDNDQTIDNIRIWTQENQTSNAYVQMMIVDVPEPATLTLLGLGLLGLGFAKRRKA